MTDDTENEVANELRPRDVAVAMIARKIAEVHKEIDAHDHWTRNPGSLFHSRIHVFLEQVAVELRRAAVYLELNDQADDEGDPGPDGEP